MSIQLQNISKAFALCFGFFAFTHFTSCREHTALDPNLVPGIDNINTFGKDANDLNASLQVVFFDSQVTNNRSVPIAAVGQLDGDPFFGDIDAGFYLQFTVPSVGYSFPEDIQSFDSVRLVLPFTGGVYGDTTSNARFEVYEINDPSFTIDTSLRKYYSFSEVDYFPALLGSVERNIYQIKNDTIQYTTTTSVTSQLAIKLDNSFLSKIEGMNEGVLYNHYSFVEYLNGFYIKSNGLSAGMRKAIYYFRLASGSTSMYDQARMEVHYTKTDGTFGITMFPFNIKYSSFYSKLVRNYLGYPVESYSHGMNTDSFLVQGGPGVQTDLTLKNLTDIEPKSRIYAARLEINMPKTSIYDILRHPPLLLLNGVNEDGSLYALADYQTSTEITATPEMLSLAQQFVGGTPFETIIDGQDHYTYYLNIPREIQRHISLGIDSIKLRVYPYYDFIGAYRFIAPGFQGTTNAKAKFNIVYGKP